MNARWSGASADRRPRTPSSSARLEPVPRARGGRELWSRGGRGACAARERPGVRGCGPADGVSRGGSAGPVCGAARGDRWRRPCGGVRTGSG